MAKKSPRVTRPYLDGYMTLDAKRKALQRQAKDIGKQLAEIEDRLIAYVHERGGEARCVTQSGYRLAITIGNGSVSWKEAYIKVAGQKKAEKLIAATETKETLEVELLK